MKIENLVRKGILEIPPYIPGKSKEEAMKEVRAPKIIKMASNENPLGPSPLAVKAINDSNLLNNLHIYPEGNSPMVVKELSEIFNIPETWIAVSNGADNIITLIGHSFINEGDEVIIPFPSFAMYNIITRIMGGVPIIVHLKDFHIDLEGMLNKVTKKTKLIFLCIPNNPTGTIITEKKLNNFFDSLSDNILVIIDEAYYDFITDNNYKDALHYIKENRNVIAVRTLSKILGLAGLRVGYAIAKDEIIDCLLRVREPFPLTTISQMAAVNGLRDKEFFEKSRQVVKEGKEYLYNELTKRDIEYIPTQSNFIFINMKKDSRVIFDEFLKNGIIIRPGYIWGYDHYIRVSIGTMEENRFFIKTIDKLLGV